MAGVPLKTNLAHEVNHMIGHLDAAVRKVAPPGQIDPPPATDPVDRLYRAGLPLIKLAATIERQGNDYDQGSTVVTYIKTLWAESVGSAPDAGPGIYLFLMAHAILRFEYARIRDDLAAMRRAVVDARETEAELRLWLERGDA